MAITSSGSSATGDGPVVVLLGEDGADEADDRGAFGEGVEAVGAAANVTVDVLPQQLSGPGAPFGAGRKPSRARA